MEQLIHYIWKHKIFPLEQLQTTDGMRVEVIDPGLTNSNSGPDFFNAKVKINGTLWVGNIEIHTHASDWFKHQHDKDKTYDSVVLHVVGEADCEVFRSNSEPIPQMILSCPANIKENYDSLSVVDSFPACYQVIPSLPLFTLHSWFSVLLSERLEHKSEAIKHRLKRCGGSWENAFLVTLARNFGFGINGDAFETWASLLSFRAIDKHRDNLLQIEAIFFGQAGLLDEKIEDAYYLRLQKEFHYLQRVFDLPVMDVTLWRFLRLRPTNFPHIRIAQFAMLYYHKWALFSHLMEADSCDKIIEILHVSTSPYWEEHYQFYTTSPKRTKALSVPSIRLIIINTVVPFLYLYGQHRSDERLCQRANDLLEKLLPETNHIIQQWDRLGLKASNAADTQALLELKNEYCDKKKCLYCRIGFEYLKRNK